MMLLGSKQPSIGKVYKFGLMATGFASGPSNDYEVDYDVKAAKAFMKKHENATETVDCMFRFNQKYVESMSKKKFKKIAAICILQGVEFNGCELWNEKVSEAKKQFIKVEDQSETETVEDASSKSVTPEAPTEKQEQEMVKNLPVVAEQEQASSKSVTPEAPAKEKVVDAKPEEVAEVVEFDSQSTFIPKPVENKKNVLFDMEALDVDLNNYGKPTEKYTKAFNKINDTVKSYKPAGTKHKLTQLPSGLIELQLADQYGNYIGSTLFDPYIVYGNRIYMQADSDIGNVVVPLERHDLISKYMRGYKLSSQEATECKSFLFLNEQVYFNIDMSEIKDFRKLTTNDYRLLGSKLEKIFILLSQKMENVPRFRFKEFRNSNSFELIADAEVKNPNNYPLWRPDHIISVKVAGNNVILEENGTTKKYKIS